MNTEPEKITQPVPEDPIEENFEGAQHKKLNRRMWIIASIAAIIILAGAFGTLYLKISSSRIYTDTAQITAPSVILSSATGGILEDMYVKEGDLVPANTPVARVGDEIVKTKTESLVILAPNNIGAVLSPGQTVITVIDPTQLRVDAQVEEDKGLSDISVGDSVTFTVDAFGLKQYQGIVDEVSPTSHEQDVVFNISQEREENNFDIKVRFNVSQYPELKNGMSAKVWIYKN